MEASHPLSPSHHPRSAIAARTHGRVRSSPSSGLLPRMGAIVAALLFASGCATPAGPGTPRADWVLPRAATPESVGLSSAQLDRLAAVTREHVASGVVPGALIVIARHGRIAYAESFGARDRAANKAMAEDAIFRLYSMTNPIVSVAVMMLVE